MIQDIFHEVDLDSLIEEIVNDGYFEKSETIRNIKTNRKLKTPSGIQFRLLIF